MKVIYSVVLLLAALTATHCYPADKKDDKATLPDKDVDFVPLADKHSGPGFPPGGVVDIDAGDDDLFGNPFIGNPFPSLLSSIEELMSRMRQQLSQILGRLPENPGDAPFPELHIPNLGDIDLGKGNTTSVTKVIDGHKVTINETEYKQDGDDGAAFFKVRIIDVHPDSEEVSTEKDAESVAPPKRDRESVEETINNEIPKTKDNEELNFDNIETFDEADLVPPHKYANVPKNANWGVRSVESIEDNSIDSAPQPVRDLSNDIYVNQLMLDAGAAPNPDAEMFEVIDGHVPSLQYYPQIKPERIVAQNYLPVNYPASDFEQVGMHRGPMPVVGSLPYFIPPMFPLNNPQYGIPIEQINKRIATDAGLSINNGQYLPVKQEIVQTNNAVQQTAPSNSIPQSTSQQESSPASNTPEAAPQQSSPVTKTQLPSTST